VAEAFLFGVRNIFCFWKGKVRSMPSFFGVRGVTFLGHLEYPFWAILTSILGDLGIPFQASWQSFSGLLSILFWPFLYPFLALIGYPFWDI
jgi:hypothetical protein